MIIEHLLTRFEKVNWKMWSRTWQSLSIPNNARWYWSGSFSIKVGAPPPFRNTITEKRYVNDLTGIFFPFFFFLESRWWPFALRACNPICIYWLFSTVSDYFIAVFSSLNVAKSSHFLRNVCYYSDYRFSKASIS